MTCYAHGGFFTVYPPGFRPYDRKPTIPLDGDRPPPAVRSRRLSKQLEGSLFEAAIAAAEGDLWERSAGDCGSERWRVTQERHVRRAALLTGIIPELDDCQRHAIARSLSVDTLQLRDMTRTYEVAENLVGRGTAVRRMLLAMADGTSMFERFCASAFVAGLRGPGYRWDADRAALRPLFRQPAPRHPRPEG